MAKDTPAIKVTNLSKSFKIPLDSSNGIKHKIINVFKGIGGYREFTPLNDVSFEIEKGDFFGIVGRNGSGKSTLLKTIAGIYNPDKGSVEVDGKLVPFIELGVGFSPELSGRENVFLNGALLGFSQEQMEAMYDDIVDFAELHDFMEERLKNYSSGMQVRLAFSIAIRADADILVLDEVLAVGDEAFQRKCNDYFKQLKKGNKTVILVTHSMDSVRKYCNKAIMIREGKIVFQGTPEDVSNEYSLENLTPSPAKSSDEVHSSIIKNLQVEVRPLTPLSQDDEVRVTVKYKAPTETSTRVKLSMHDIDRNVPIFASDSQLLKGGDVSTTLVTKLSSINDSNVKLSVSIRNKDYDTLAFLADSKAPIIAVRRSDYKNPAKKTTWATLFDRGEWR